MGRKKNHKINSGFTLIEILLVVGIIILLAALAIPNLLRVRLNADEASAVASLRSISRGCENFRAAQTPPTFPSILTELSDSSPIYLDSFLTAGTIHGYSITYEPNLPHQYTCIASPLSPGITGERIFEINEAGVISSDGIAIQ